MQIVAVTDPLQLGFGRQAMVGIHVDGAVAARGRRALGDGGGHLRGDDRRHLRRAVRGGQRRRRGAARPWSPAASGPSRACAPPRRSCTSSSPSRPTPGASGEPGSPRPAARSRCGTTPLARPSCRDPRCPGPRRTTSWWSVPDSPACGRRTTCSGPTRRLRIAVLEQEFAGFGASGRNGGWCSALFPTSWTALVAASSTDGALRQHRAMQRDRPRGRSGRRARGHRGALPPRRHRLAGPHAGAARAAARRGARPPAPAASPRTTSGCSSADEAARDARRRRRARRHLHPALRGGAPGPAGARARPRRRGRAA